MRSNLTRTSRILVLGAMAVILVLFAAIVWAQGNADDPEDGRVSPIDGAGSPDHVELQFTPDPGAPPGVSQDPEGDTTPPATSAEVADEVETQFDPNAPAEEVILFKFIAGASFHPREAATTHQYNGSGCINRTSTNGFFVSDLQLPEGAEIDFLRLYFDDTSDDNDAQAWIYAYDGLGGFSQITTVASSGTPGQSSAGSGFFSYVVDNTAESLGLVAGVGSASDSSVTFCGVRLRYKIEVPSYMMLPAVLKQNTAE